MLLKILFIILNLIEKLIKKILRIKLKSILILAVLLMLYAAAIVIIPRM